MAKEVRSSSKRAKKGLEQDVRKRTAKKRAFLAAYAACGNITQACEMSDVGRQTHYDWLEKDPDYPAMFRLAEEQAADTLEKEARRRAIEGVRRMKFGRDGSPLINPDTGQPYVEHEYSDTLLIFLLKGIRPEKYRDNVRVEATGKGGGPIEVKSDLTAGLPQDLIEKELARLRGGGSE